MNGRFFLDTNVFVYVFDPLATLKQGPAKELVDRALRTRKGIISYQIVQEFFSVSLHRFAKPMSLADAERYFETVFRPLLSIHSSEHLYRSAIRLFAAHRLAWYDALVVSAALEGECAVLFSEDMQHGRRFDNLVIQNPFLTT